MLFIRTMLLVISASSVLVGQAWASGKLTAEQVSGNSVKPNLVIILTDDQGYNDVGFNGSPDIRTPNIDNIAAQGTRFTNGYVTFPVCGPSRAGLLTGRYQGRFGFTINPTIDPSVEQNGIPTSEKNIAEVLQPAGYKSAIIGKWHMGTHPDLRPNQRGFDFFYGFLSGGHRYFPEELTINDLGDVKNKFDWYKTRLLRNETREDISKYLTDELSDEAVEFIKREKDNPFFLYVAYNAPHAPVQATQEYLDRNQHIKDKKRRTYAAMISSVDDGVGRIMETLQQQGIDDNTLVVFLSDNGGAKTNGSDNGELRGHKNLLFEGGVRVPFAMRWPGKIPAGVDYHQPISSLDIMATIVSQANVDTSDNKPLDGVDLIPFLTGDIKGQPHDVLFWRHVKTDSHALRRGDDKIVHDRQGDYLFDMQNDFVEQDNLLPQKAAQYQTLEKEYQAWEAQLIDAIFPGLNHWPKTTSVKKSKKNKKKNKNKAKQK
ncbi:N-acetylgalactosamine 6-sulfate sulfatase [Thalassotalea sp. HSM 43]|uniref:sulfatase-like hydrolase/transferase n=1 Tax=Thalassotalea sp. HSM 43 TaxID=2552945 RepID=UPI00108157FF|nr:sulfatase-like hydrolase/transferase [Thalassotalea sp. HSM 43]QBY04248.1 N-acetylgalactosamine 6-sulfate sulfatase [Thalassotalea sp. HSM 43]